MLYSIKMRSAQGGPHEKGGRHISGAERILSEEKIEQTLVAMLHRAQEKTAYEIRNCDWSSDVCSSDLIVKPSDICYSPLLPFSSCQAVSAAEGRQTAVKELVRAGVSVKAAAAGIYQIKNLRDSMRGAMLLDAQSGERVDGLGERGVRVSKMDCADPEAYEAILLKQGLSGDHVREALVLASKVVGAQGIVAELCWSDDPDYVTGYVASGLFGYRRIPCMKEQGDPIGGRVFFTEPGTDLQQLITYLQEQVVLIRSEEG